MEDKRLGEILVEEGKASEEDVRRALEMQARVGGRVGRLLVAMGIVGEEVLVSALSRQLRVPKVSLRGRTAGPGLTALIPYELARRRLLLPVALSRSGESEVVYVATADPTDRAGIEEVREVCRREVIPLLAPYDELHAAIERSYHASRNPASAAAAPPPPTPPAPTSTASTAVPPAPSEQSEAAPAAPAETGWDHVPLQQPHRTPLLVALTRLLLRKGVFTEDELEEEIRRQ